MEMNEGPPTNSFFYSLICFLSLTEAGQSGVNSHFYHVTTIITIINYCYLNKDPRMPADGPQILRFTEKLGKFFLAPHRRGFRQEESGGPRTSITISHSSSLSNQQDGA